MPASPALSRQPWLPKRWRSTGSRLEALVAPTPAPAPVPSERILHVEDLGVRFVSRDGDVSILNGVTFSLDRGEVLCLLGESGSGKSVTLRTLLGILPPTARVSGRMDVDGQNLVGASESELRRVRGSKIAMIFQEPATALDPVFTIGHQIGETLVEHKGLSWADARARALQLLELVQIPSARQRLDAYPHELSGGLKQRAMIALALSCDPKLLLADEPTTALDATVQIQVLLLLRELQRELGMATVFVTHDLGVACEIADRVGVMYAGRLVEGADVAAIIKDPLHPYTQALMRSTVQAGMRGKVLDAIPGSPPDLAMLPPGCSFAPRCRHARAHCLAVAPDLIRLPGARAGDSPRDMRCHIHGDEEAYRVSAPVTA